MFRRLQSITPDPESMTKKKARLTLRKRKPRKSIIAWPVRGILEERTDNKGRKEYLCDWEPDESGIDYEPTWVRRSNSKEACSAAMLTLSFK